MSGEAPSPMPTYRRRAVVWLAAIALSAIAIAIKAGFAHLYRDRLHTTADLVTTIQPGYVYWNVLAPLDSHPKVPLWQVRFVTHPYGPLVVESATSAESARYTCTVPPAGRTQGWRVTFEFYADQLLEMRVAYFDDPTIAWWNAKGRLLEGFHVAAGLVVVSAAGAGLLAALVLWRSRRSIAIATAATALIGCTLALLTDAPGRTFRPVDPWRHMGWPAGMLVAAAVLIAWPVKPVPVRGRCAQCGYDLTGNVSGICPECGKNAPVRPDYAASIAGLNALADPQAEAQEDGLNDEPRVELPLDETHVR